MEGVKVKGKVTLTGPCLQDPAPHGATHNMRAAQPCLTGLWCYLQDAELLSRHSRLPAGDACELHCTMTLPSRRAPCTQWTREQRTREHTKICAAAAGWVEVKTSQDETRLVTRSRGALQLRIRQSDRREEGMCAKLLHSVSLEECNASRIY